MKCWCTRGYLPSTDQRVAGSCAAERRNKGYKGGTPSPDTEESPVFDFRRAGALIAATTTTAVVLTAAPFAAAAEADQVTICLLYTSDAADE